MNQTCGEINKNIRNSERGEGGYKLILFLIGLFLVGWAGFNYIPVDYNARAYKQEMEATVQQAVVLPAAMNKGMLPTIAAPPPITTTGNTSNAILPGAAMARRAAPDPNKMKAVVL